MSTVCCPLYSTAALSHRRKKLSKGKLWTEDKCNTNNPLEYIFSHIRYIFTFLKRNTILEQSKRKKRKVKSSTAAG
jgi:hypothetical protein